MKTVLEKNNIFLFVFLYRISPTLKKKRQLISDIYHSGVIFQCTKRHTELESVKTAMEKLVMNYKG